VSFEQPHAADRSWWRKINPRWYVLAVLLAVTVLAARPVYRYLRTLRAESLARQAQVLIDEKNWQAAAERAYSGYQLAPNNPLTLLTLCRLYTAVGSEQALPFWEAYLAHTQAADEERRQITKVALQFGRFDLAQRQIAALLQSPHRIVEDYLLASNFYLRIGNKVQAIAMARDALAFGGQRPQTMLQLACLLTDAPQRENRLEAKKIWFWLCQNSPNNRLQALVTLSKMEELDATESRTVLEQLNALGDSNPELYLTAQEFKARLQPTNRRSIMDETLQRFAGRPAAQQVLLGRWLMQQRELRLLLKFIDEKTALSSQDFLLLRLDGLAGLAQWNDVSTLLRNERLPLEPLLRELYQARAQKELHHPEAAALHWNRVHGYAGEKPELWLYAAQYAERSGAFDEAEKIYRRLSLKPETARLGYTGLVRLCEKQNSTRQLRDLLQEMSSTFPNDPIPQNDLAYLNLLLGENIAAATQTAARLVKEYPAFLSFRVTLALAFLRNDRLADALELLTNDQHIDWDVALPGWRAVLVAVLAKNNRAPEAVRHLRQIPQTLLKPEEKALVSGLQNQSPVVEKIKPR
jgi:hypothetical protein